ncbi:MAG: hypothetical protein WBB27_04895, partial [Maribacter sp.]
MKKVYKIITLVFVISIYFACDESDDTSSGITLTTEDFTITAPLVVRELDTLGLLRGRSNEGEVTFSLLSQIPENSVVLGRRFGEIIVANPAVFNTGV